MNLLDLNAFFASCEQQDNAALRGKPIIVAQMLTGSTSAIAASYETKAFGVKTGMHASEAKRLCPSIIAVKANHKRYSEYHERILAAVDICIPVEKMMSIDELACKLRGKERQILVALDLAIKIKRTIRERVGECLRCSIGLAPNVFLGKGASDIQKPDGWRSATSSTQSSASPRSSHRKPHGRLSALAICNRTAWAI